MRELKGFTNVWDRTWHLQIKDGVLHLFMISAQQSSWNTRIYFNIYLQMNKCCGFTHKKNLVIMKDKFWTHNTTLWRDIKASGAWFSVLGGLYSALPAAPTTASLTAQKYTAESLQRTDGFFRWKEVWLLLNAASKP